MLGFTMCFSGILGRRRENNENQLVEIPEGKVRGLRERFFQVHVGSPYVRTARRTREIAAGGVKK